MTWEKTNWKWIENDWLTHSQNKPWILRLQYKSFENTVGKGEIARNKQFILFCSVFYLSRDLFAMFIKFEIVVCKLFQFGGV